MWKVVWKAEGATEGQRVAGCAAVEGTEEAGGTEEAAVCEAAPWDTAVAVVRAALWAVVEVVALTAA